MDDLRGLSYEIGRGSNKSDPRRLKLARIIARCKFIPPDDIAGDTVSSHAKDDSSHPPTAGYIYTKSGEFEEGARGWGGGKGQNTVANVTHIFGGRYRITSEARRPTVVIGGNT